MILSSGCPPWRPEQPSDPAEHRRSYTSPRDTIQSALVNSLSIWARAYPINERHCAEVEWAGQASAEGQCLGHKVH